METTVGLGALGFWLFIASVVVGGMWFDSRKRESQQESLRRLVESGKHIDSDVLDKILAASGNKSHPDQDLKIAGLIMLFIAPGLLVMGWFMAALAEELWTIMLGVSGLVAFIAIGLLVASRVCESSYNEKQD